MKARSLFVGGTSSNAGKSWMATAICAWLRRRGVSVAPFKAQNMSNNSYPCRAGGEIGRAQVAQAEACGARARALDEPDSAQAERKRAQPGRRERPRVEDADAPASTTRTPTSCDRSCSRRTRIWPVASMRSSSKAQAASSELNLRQHDLVNLGLVTRIRAPWILVADIERGGVFASVIGTAHLLSPEERALFRGFAINKFRGDVSLFDDGVRSAGTRDGGALLRRVPVRRRHPPGRGGQPRAEDQAADAGARQARASRSSDCRTCRTRPTSGC